MGKLLSQDVFLKQYNTDFKEFEATGLKWADLEYIYDDYIKIRPSLEESAVFFFNSIMKIKNVHSVRYRVKDPEHVIEKIIRKRIKDPQHIISFTNYKDELTDLIGIRALHLFKEQWKPIHKVVTDLWEMKEKPVANHRKGDSDEYIAEFKSMDCEIKEHDFGYRSVHYIAVTKPAKVKYYVEIQVRTIFEEAWSEIDHTIRYPYDQYNAVYNQFLSVLNRLSGSADEMGTFISFLKSDLIKKEELHKTQLSDKDSIIAKLAEEIRKLGLKESETKVFASELGKLKDSMGFERGMFAISDNDVSNPYLNSIKWDGSLTGASTMRPTSAIASINIPTLGSIKPIDYEPIVIKKK